MIKNVAYPMLIARPSADHSDPTLWTRSKTGLKLDILLANLPT
jgi:hypothetical protein